MRIYTGREEAQSAERVGTLSRVNVRWYLIIHSAKYIEGLENRLGRMESLLKLSGLLPEEDNGKTDLGTLEKRLADKTAALNASSKGFNRSGSVAAGSTTGATPPQDGSALSPRSTVGSPDNGDKES